MVNTEIDKAVEFHKLPFKKLNIFFKQRNSIEAYFVKAPDYIHLKEKNFWRVVNTENIDQWNKTKNINLTRLFNGTEFSKLK